MIMRIIFFIAFTFFLSSLICFADTQRGDIHQGNEFFRDEKFDEAIQEYSRVQTSKSNTDIVNYNLGSALYKKKEYGKSISSFNEALGISEDSDLEAKTNYNIGNARYREGELKESKDPAKALSDYKKSVGYYKRSMELDPNDEDAKFNYEYVTKKLEQLSQQQQSQPQQQE